MLYCNVNLVSPPQETSSSWKSVISLIDIVSSANTGGFTPDEFLHLARPERGTKKFRKAVV